MKEKQALGMEDLRKRAGIVRHALLEKLLAFVLII
jgi:hypothetical protein